MTYTLMGCTFLLCGTEDEMLLLYNGFAVEFSGLNQGSGSFRNVGDISIQVSVSVE